MPDTPFSLYYHNFISRWEPGQQLKVIGIEGGGILLKSGHPFPPAIQDQEVACLRYSGPTKTLTDMEEAICKV